MNESNMKELPRSNIYAAIVLNIVTLGIYSVAWLHRMAHFLNKKSKHEVIPKFSIYICYLLLIPEILSIYPSYFFPLYFIFKIILIFDVRKQIHKHCQIASEKNQFFLNPIYSFLFGFLYLVYKVDTYPTKTSTPNNQNLSA